MRLLSKIGTLLFVALLTLEIGCESATPECVAKCALVPDPGFCEALFPRFYFDPKTGKCDTFIYGGCGGVVPFETMKECLDCGCD
jgi:hypothetical protein